MRKFTKFEQKFREINFVTKIIMQNDFTKFPAMNLISISGLTLKSSHLISRKIAVCVFCQHPQRKRNFPLTEFDTPILFFIFRPFRKNCFRSRKKDLATIFRSPYYHETYALSRTCICQTWNLIRENSICNVFSTSKRCCLKFYYNILLQMW